MEKSSVRMAKCGPPARRAQRFPNTRGGKLTPWP